MEYKVLQVKFAGAEVNSIRLNIYEPVMGSTMVHTLELSKDYAGVCIRPVDSQHRVPARLVDELVAIWEEVDMKVGGVNGSNG